MPRMAQYIKASHPFFSRSPAPNKSKAVKGDDFEKTLVLFHQMYDSKFRAESEYSLKIPLFMKSKSAKAIGREKPVEKDRLVMEN